MHQLRVKHRYANARVFVSPLDFFEERSLKIRYKLHDSDASILITRPVTRADEAHGIETAPREARLADTGFTSSCAAGATPATSASTT